MTNEVEVVTGKSSTLAYGETGTQYMMHTAVSGGSCLQEFVSRLGLKPGQRVLDVGCGIGGSCFLMAQQNDVYVHGVDLSVNMVLVALDRAAANDRGSKVWCPSDVITASLFITR